LHAVRRKHETEQHPQNAPAFLHDIQTVFSRFRIRAPLTYFYGGPPLFVVALVDRLVPAQERNLPRRRSALLRGATKIRFRTATENRHRIGVTYHNRIVCASLAKGGGGYACSAAYAALSAHASSLLITVPRLLCLDDSMRYKGAPPCVAAGPDTSPEPRFSDLRLLPILEFIARCRGQQGGF
jgi:hypothetical protein